MKWETCGPLRYYQRGEKIKLVIHSGTHGDEFHVIPILTEVIAEMEQELPDFLFVPEISPSAVAAQHHSNQYGNDMNRGFGGLSDPEVDANKSLLQRAHGALGISFHEDLQLNQFYLYDSSTLSSVTVDVLRREMTRLSVPIYDGIDNPDDPALSYKITQGYVDYIGRASETGIFIEDWAFFYGYLQRFLTFEVPYTHPNVKECVRSCVRFSVELCNVLQFPHAV